MGMWLLILVGIIFFIYVNNRWIEVSNYEITSNKLTKDYKVVLISDYHNEYFPNLVKLIKQQNPDLILIAGDLVDRHSYKFDLPKALYLIAQIKDIAPIYFVPGNHEAQREYDFIKEQLLELDVNVLDDNALDINNIHLIGCNDPTFLPEDNLQGITTTKIEETLKDNYQEDKFNLLLIHRPEHIKVYAKYLMDLVVCGHCHGGQVRLPFIKGIYSPGQGILPKYTKGLYQIEKTKMIVCAGLGNTGYLVRVFNRPNLVVIKLKKQN